MTIPEALVNPAELFLHIPQTSHLYTPWRGRSEIWKYFKLKEDDESHKRWAVCNKCPKSILFVGATSNLWGHMRVELPITLINNEFIFRRHPTSTHPQEPSHKSGNTLNSRKMRKWPRGGLCVPSVQIL